MALFEAVVMRIGTHGGLEFTKCRIRMRNIPRLSKAGMPSRSECWGGLFKAEQYRLIWSASRAFMRSLRNFKQTTPPLRGSPPY